MSDDLDYDHDEPNLVEAIHTKKGAEIDMTDVLYQAERLYHSNNTITEILEALPHTGLHEQARYLCALYIGRLWEYNSRTQAIKVIDRDKLLRQAEPDK